jgi:hypothetical protein
MNEIPNCETKREKHIELHDAIQQIDAISQSLDELIYRLEGPVPDVNAVCEVKESLPSFMDVLNGGAGAILEKTDRAIKRIMRLNELLF